MSQSHVLNLDESCHDRLTQTQIRIKIPQKHHNEPIIFQLASRHQLEVNIQAAILGVNAEGSGWFDLLLKGSSESIDNALVYLSELDVEILNSDRQEIDGW